MQSVRIRSFCDPYFPVFSRIRAEYGPEKPRIRILFTQCKAEVAEKLRDFRACHNFPK